MLYGLDQDAALYQLRFYNRDEGHTLPEYNAALQLEGGIEKGITKLFVRTNTAYQDSYLGATSKTTVYEAFLSVKPAPSLTIDAGKKTLKWGKGLCLEPRGLCGPAEESRRAGPEPRRLCRCLGGLHQELQRAAQDAFHHPRARAGLGARERRFWGNEPSEHGREGLSPALRHGHRLPVPHGRQQAVALRHGLLPEHHDEPRSPRRVRPYQRFHAEFHRRRREHRIRPCTTRRAGSSGSGISPKRTRRTSSNTTGTGPASPSRRCRITSPSCTTRTIPIFPRETTRSFRRRRQ